MPGATIVKIERIQNRELWKIYQAEVDYINHKYGGDDDANVEEMYHGTRGTPPF